MTAGRGFGGAMALMDPTRPASPLVVAGRYTTVRFLGEGAFSEVYAAWDDLLQRRVALKLVWAASGKRPGVSPKRFLTEARTAARINHPNVVAIHDVGSHGDVPYLVMEELDRSLGDELAAGQPDLRRICRILADVCAGLAAVHAVGVVHRDVKPANILLAGDGRAKLADFGIARSSEETDPGTLWNAGTPPYLPPERLVGEPAGPPCDVWAIGVVLYEALTGSRPFPTPYAVLALKCGPDDTPLAGPLDAALREHDPDPGLVRQVVATLAPQPGDRPGAAELSFALSRLAAIAEAAPRAVTPQPVQRQAPTELIAPEADAQGIWGVWDIEIAVDPAWYTEQEVDQPCPATGTLGVAALDPAGVLVGRPSASLGSRPAIDLSSDIGISRRHCRFIATAGPDGAGVSWSVEDLSSSNGTFVAPAGAPLPVEPLTPGVPRELAEGDRIYVGAWTRLTLRRRPRSPAA